MNAIEQNISLKLFRVERLHRRSYKLVNCLYKAIVLGVISCCTMIGLRAMPVNPTGKVDLEQHTEKVAINPQTDTIPEQLDEIIVTAYKASLPLKLSAKMVNIILPKQIERSPVKSIEDLLNYHSGVDVLQRGSRMEYRQTSHSVVAHLTKLQSS